MRLAGRAAEIQLMRMPRQLVHVEFGVAAVAGRPGGGPACVPGAAPAPEQTARRQDGVRAARTINNLETKQARIRIEEVPDPDSAPLVTVRDDLDRCLR